MSINPYPMLGEDDDDDGASKKPGAWTVSGSVSAHVTDPEQIRRLRLCMGAVSFNHEYCGHASAGPGPNVTGEWVDLSGAPQEYLDGKPFRARVNGDDCRIVADPKSRELCRVQPFLGGTWRLAQIVSHGWSSSGWSVVVRPRGEDAGHCPRGTW